MYLLIWIFTVFTPQESEVYESKDFDFLICWCITNNQHNALLIVRSKNYLSNEWTNVRYFTRFLVIFRYLNRKRAFPRKNNSWKKCLFLQMLRSITQSVELREKQHLGKVHRSPWLPKAPSGERGRGWERCIGLSDYPEHWEEREAGAGKGVQV